MTDKSMDVYEKLAEKIVSEFDTGTRLDIFLVVQSKNPARIDRTSQTVADTLKCSATKARIAMKMYVAKLSQLDPEIKKQLQ